MIGGEATVRQLLLLQRSAATFARSDLAAFFERAEDRLCATRSATI